MSNSYKDIMKATSITGSVQVIRLFFGLIRNKMIALLFGPAGLGVWGLYQSFTDMVQSAASLGLDKSAVKQIAENHDDLKKRNLAIKVTQYSVAIFSLICSISVAIFAEDISKNIFGSVEYKVGVWVCSLVIFINSVTAALKAVLNGLSEIKVLAVSQLMGVLFGNVVVFSLLPFLDAVAIPFYFLVIAAAAFIPVLAFYRRLGLSFVKSTFAESFATLSQLMKLGLAFWVSAFFMAFITYMINIFLKDKFSLDVVGIYQASWVISNLYIGVILTAMGVAFFPKVSKTIDDIDETRKVINEQIEFGLLISLPFVLVFFVFAPVFLMLLYSSSFEIGETIIRWFILGVIIRLLGFPLSYALMAKGRPLFYVVGQFVLSLANYCLLLLFVDLYGYEGLGMNYFIAYCVYIFLLIVFCYQALDYIISVSILKVIAVYLLCLFASLMVFTICSGMLFYFYGFIIVVLSAVYSYRQLVTKINVDIVGYLKSKMAK